MKNRFFYVVATLGITALLTVGCSKVPQEEIDAANQAFQEAVAAGAELYVPESYLSLKDSLDGVMVNLEARKSKVIRNYGSVREELENVIQYAGEVKQLAEYHKEELRMEIQTAISEVKSLIEANRLLILEAPRGKEGTSALLAIKGELDAVESSINQADTMLENGDYLSTLEKVNAAQEKAASINAELTQVIEKYKANARSGRS